MRGGGERPRARRRPASRGEIRRLRSLVAINRAIVGAVDYDEVLRLVVDETAALTGADACILLLAGEDGQATVAASSGLDAEEARRFEAPLDEHLDEALRALLGLGPKDTFVGSPVIGGHSVRGVLAVYHRARPGGAPRRDEPFLVSALADQGALAIEHARYRREHAAAERELRDRAAKLERAHASERRLREDLQAVSEASTAVSEAILATPRTGVEAVFRAVLNEARRLTGAEYAALGFGTDPERPFDPFVVAGMPPGIEAKIGRWPRPVGTFGLVAREGVTVRATDVRRHPAFLGLPPGHPEVTSLLGVPIAHEGRAAGNLYLANKRGADAFTDEDMVVARMLGARVSVSLAIARLYDAAVAGRAWLQAVVDQMPDAVVLLDAEGRVAARSGAARAMSSPGDGRRDPFGNAITLDLYRPSGERLAPEDLPHVRALARGERIAQLELALRTPGRGLVPVLVDAVQVRGPRGEVIGATAVFQDVSERKEMERMREEWMGVIAHNLRQPVSVIGLASRLLQSAREAPLSEAETKQLDRIRHGVDRLGTMIAELLDLSLLDARRLQIKPRAINVVTLAREVIERAADLTAGHPVSVHEAGEPLVAFANPDRVEQVLSNLLSNAAKYGAPRAEIRVDVEGRGREVEVSVTNRGRGMPHNEVSRLFQRFMRSRESRASDTPGIGLGLYICKGLVEAQGGRIWAESEPGHSMRFHFTLPAHATAEEEPHAA